MRKFAGAEMKESSLNCVCPVLICYLQFRPAADVGRRRPREARSWGLALASCDKMLGEGGVVIMENGEPLPRRLNGKEGVPPGVRSKAPVKGIFMGADFGMTSGRRGSSPLLEEEGEGDLWSSRRDLFLGLWLGDSSAWLPSPFLAAVDKSCGRFLLS